FIQAEDGIRDLTVTGVQTCALPISQEIAPPIRVRALRSAFLVFGDTLLLSGRMALLFQPTFDSRLAPSLFSEPLTCIFRSASLEIGRASCRERGWIAVGVGAVNCRW